MRAIDKPFRSDAGTDKPMLGEEPTSIDSRTVALVRDRHDLDLRLYEAAVSLNATRGHPIP